ncbi:hypothetical protein [Mastigocladopsis repens]|uniref:hypothetical protein n=1 Tax=Mastigocladopsis repens TaxID=221287 RepID=UPI0012E9D5E4|nr:hypothetical protein [Mastigocladopsis repens]
MNPRYILGDLSNDSVALAIELFFSPGCIPHRSPASDQTSAVSAKSTVLLGVRAHLANGRLVTSTLQPVAQNLE